MTTHMDGDAIIRYLNRYDFDTVTLPFHLRDTSRANAVAYCAERGIGVIAMNPLAGGALAKPAPVLQSIAKSLGFESMTEAALRFLITYPGVTTALAGITYADQAVEDAAAIGKGKIPQHVSDELLAKVQELYANVQHFCTVCKSCEEKCPNRLPVSELMAAAKEKWPS